MSDEWYRGAMNVAKGSSWHQKETLCEMSTAADMIDAGINKTKAWPVSIAKHAAFADGIALPESGIVATYADGTRKGLGSVRGRFHATTPESWQSLCVAACAAGATPTGAFSLRGGSRVLATFEIGKTNGLKNQFMLADSFDGSIKLCSGNTSIRVVCANTLRAAFSADGQTMAKLRHTATLEAKIPLLREAIAQSLQSGEAMRDLYHRAEKVQLARPAFEAIFDKLWPEADKEAKAAGKTRAENARRDAIQAGLNPINRVGGPGNLATLWNAATFLVDRSVDGNFRECKGEADALDSLLFGSRAKRLEEIQSIIEVVMKSGEVERMTVNQAREHGIDDKQMAKKLVEEILSDA